MIPRQEALYKSCWCEENVYKLLEKSREREGVFAVFISNEQDITPLWSQQSRPSGYVAWDYHVIALRKSEDGVKVYDLDSILEWGVDFDTWWKRTINEEHEFSKLYPRVFRLINADVYLRIFYSDRSHMRGSDGQFHSVAPEWSCIRPKKGSNVKLLADMSESIEDTLVLNEKEMKQYFTE